MTGKKSGVIFLGIFLSLLLTGVVSAGCTGTNSFSGCTSRTVSTCTSSMPFSLYCQVMYDDCIPKYCSQLTTRTICTASGVGCTWQCSSNSDCYANEICSSGTCVTKCSDSDGGNVLSTFGTVSLYSGETYPDLCALQGSGVYYIDEYYCDASGNAVHNAGPCPAGQTCNGGACISDTLKSTAECTITDSCAASNTVMKLYGTTNSHGALWNDASATKYLCCNFAGTHTCNSTNEVVQLYSSSNSHASSPDSTVNANSVCFGGLQCDSTSSSCPSGKTEILSLSSSTNAHLGGPGDYSNKICCTLPGGVEIPCEEDSDCDSLDGCSADGSSIVEGVCSIEGICETTIIESCPQGYKCSGGTCVPSSICTFDSECDYLDGCSSDGKYITAGECNIDEGICELIITDTCPSGTTCVSGECVEEEESVVYWADEYENRIDTSQIYYYPDKKTSALMKIDNSEETGTATFELQGRRDCFVQIGSDCTYSQIKTQFETFLNGHAESLWTFSDENFNAKNILVDDTGQFRFGVNGGDWSETLKIKRTEDYCSMYNPSTCLDYNNLPNEIAQIYCEDNQCDVENEECEVGDAHGCYWNDSLEEGQKCQPKCTPIILCGNDQLDPGEQCEIGDTKLCPGSTTKYMTCTIPPPDGCMWDYSNCPGPVNCGNENIDEGEDCDGADLNGKNCTTTGLDEFIGGDLSCYDSCKFDVSNCIRCEPDGYCNDNGICEPSYLGECDMNCPGDCYCGNNQVDPGEECEFGYSELCNDGTNYKSCTGNCMWDNSNCQGPVTCSGNGIDPGEECDGSDLNDETCMSTGYDSFEGGILDCYYDCTFDLSGCERRDFSEKRPIPGTCYSVNDPSSDPEGCADDGFLSYSRISTWEWNILNTNHYDPIMENGKTRSQNCKECDPNSEYYDKDVCSEAMSCPAQIQLPFFNFYNLIATLAVIGLIYVMINYYKKEHKRKK